MKAITSWKLFLAFIGGFSLYSCASSGPIADSYSPYQDSGYWDYYDYYDGGYNAFFNDDWFYDSYDYRYDRTSPLPADPGIYYDYNYDLDLFDWEEDSIFE